MAAANERDGGNRSAPVRDGARAGRRWALGAAVLLIAAVSIGRCTPADGPASLADAAPRPVAAPVPPQGITLPPVAAQADYQLREAYPPPKGTEIVVRDRLAAPEPGLYNICYINALQAQPAEVDWWEANYPQMLLRDDSGELVIDGEWDEPVLDISSEANRAVLMSIQAVWIDGCAAAGYDAVEPDNQDVYYRGPITVTDVTTYLSTFTAYAHTRNLAVAQKNGQPELGTMGRDGIGFDFVIAEECSVWRECDDYKDVYGSAIIEIEYTDQPASAFAAACAVDGEHHSIIRRDRELVTPDDPDYFYESC